MVGSWGSRLSYPGRSDLHFKNITLQVVVREGPGGEGGLVSGDSGEGACLHDRKAQWDA